MLASIKRRVGLLMSKNASVGATISDFLELLKAWSYFVGQKNSILVVRRGQIGSRRPVMVLVLAESWFNRPKN